MFMFDLGTGLHYNVGGLHNRMDRNKLIILFHNPIFVKTCYGVSIVTRRNIMGFVKNPAT